MSVSCKFRVLMTGGRLFLLTWGLRSPVWPSLLPCLTHLSSGVRKLLELAQLPSWAPVRLAHCDLQPCLPRPQQMCPTVRRSLVIISWQCQQISRFRELNRFSQSSAIDKTSLYNVNVKCQIVTNSNFSLHIRDNSEDIQYVTIEPSEQNYSFSYLCPPMTRMTEAAQREHEQPWPPVHGLLRAEGPLQNQTSTKSTGDSS